LPRGFIPDNIIQQIKDHVDIVDVISEYVPLTAAGKYFKGLCPFHEEKTPSFMVNRDRQFFRCFGCNEGGDVFTFLMKHEKMKYPEAVRSLAVRCGITIPETTQGDAKANLAAEELQKLNRSAVNYFHRVLMNSAAGKDALTYLKERGIKDSTIDSFKLGFSLPSWDAFLKAAGKAGFSTKTMLQGGFILQKKSGSGYYDRFHERIMFPIFDARGEPIGFGGRILESSESDIKYMNSPETPLYNKSRSLYNLNLAHQPIRKEGFAILAEGYMDVIICFQEGIHNIVASLGTSLSEGHVNLLKRYTDEVIIAYDSDSAGAAATSRGLNLLLKGGIKVRMLTLTKGKDPDDFVREEGIEPFRDLIASAVDLVDYKLDRVQEQVDINSVDGKKQAVEDLVATLANLNNQVEKHEYVKKCAERLSVEEDYIWQQLAQIGAGKRVRRSTQPTVKSSPKLSARENIERRLLECLIQHPELIKLARSQITKEDFSNPGHAELAEILWMDDDVEKGGMDLGKLINLCESKESQDIISGLILRKSSPPDGEAVFNGCVKKMREFREREFRRSVLRESTEDSLSVAKQLMELRRKKKSINDSL
jgi:DNA primase